MSADLEAILKALGGIIALEKEISISIAAEKDARRREKLQKAIEDRDLAAIREMLYEIK